MLSGAQITAAGLTDWRKLGQALHARFVIRDLRTGVRFLQAIAEAVDDAGHSPEIRMGTAYVDLKLLSGDAIYRDDAGTEHQVAWVTQKDVDLARRISAIASEQSLPADPRVAPRSSWPWTPRTPPPSRRCGRHCSRASPTRRVAAPSVTMCATPRTGCRSSGSRKRSRTRLPASGSTSTCSSRTTSPRSVSPPQWRQGPSSSTTAERRQLPSSRTLTATRLASAHFNRPPTPSNNRRAHSHAAWHAKGIRPARR